MICPKAYASDILFHIASHDTKRRKAGLALVQRADMMDVQGRKIPTEWMRTARAVLPNIRWCAVAHS